MAVPKRDTLGSFYIVQLYPDFEPTAVKFGFSTNLEQRLIYHRWEKRAPAAEFVKSWPALKMWEDPLIDCAAVGCPQVKETEMYLVDSLPETIGRVDRFIARHDVLRTGTPPPAVRSWESGRLIAITDAVMWYPVKEQVIRNLIAAGTLRRYYLPILYSHSPEFIDDVRLDAALDALKRGERKE